MTVSRDKSGEPVMCSKCNMAFKSDSDYMQHYSEKHKPVEEQQKEEGEGRERGGVSSL
jgi:uncharacterized C2H2 Zn-finger protein